MLRARPPEHRHPHCPPSDKANVPAPPYHRFLHPVEAPDESPRSPVL